MYYTCQVHYRVLFVTLTTSVKYSKVEDAKNHPVRWSYAVYDDVNAGERFSEAKVMGSNRARCLRK